jgi:hypothetical protein
VPQQLEHTFAAPADAVWKAVKRALPAVAHRATFWEHEHRVEWSTDLAPTDWGQKMAVSVQAVDAQSCVVTFEGQTLGWPPTLLDPRHRKQTFGALVDDVTRALHDLGAGAGPATDEDGVRWWNGVAWRDTRDVPEPGPPAPGRPPPAWHPDPSGRHQLRYWGGRGWTEHVSDNGTTARDPL